LNRKNQKFKLSRRVTFFRSRQPRQLFFHVFAS
jgi:hypothetical protein